MRPPFPSLSKDIPNAEQPPVLDDVDDVELTDFELTDSQLTDLEVDGTLDDEVTRRAKMPSDFPTAVVRPDQIKLLNDPLQIEDEDDPFSTTLLGETWLLEELRRASRLDQAEIRRSEQDAEVISLTHRPGEEREKNENAVQAVAQSTPEDGIRQPFAAPRSWEWTYPIFISSVVAFVSGLVSWVVSDR